MDVIDLTNSPPSKAARHDPTPTLAVDAQLCSESPVAPQPLRAEIDVHPQVRPQPAVFFQLLRAGFDVHPQPVVCPQRADVTMRPQALVRPQPLDLSQLLWKDVDVRPRPVVRPQPSIVPELLRADINVRPQPHMHQPTMPGHFGGGPNTLPWHMISHRTSVMRKLHAGEVNGDDVMAVVHYYLGGRLIRDDWTEAEHELFLMGVKRYGKGSWAKISIAFVITKTPHQVSRYGQGLYGPPPSHYPGIFTSSFKRVRPPPIIIPQRLPSLNSKSPAVRPLMSQSTPSDSPPPMRQANPKFEDIFKPVVLAPVGIPEQFSPPVTLTLVGRHAHPDLVPQKPNGVVKPFNLTSDIGLQKQPSTLVASNRMDMFNPFERTPVGLPKQPTQQASNPNGMFRPVVQTTVGVSEPPPPQPTLSLFPIGARYSTFSAENKKRSSPMGPEELEKINCLAPAYWTLAQPANVELTIGRRWDKDDMDTSNN